MPSNVSIALNDKNVHDAGPTPGGDEQLGCANKADHVLKPSSTGPKFKGPGIDHGPLHESVSMLQPDSPTNRGNSCQDGHSPSKRQCHDSCNSGPHIPAVRARAGPVPHDNGRQGLRKLAMKQAATTIVANEAQHTELPRVAQVGTLWLMCFPVSMPDAPA